MGSKKKTSPKKSFFKDGRWRKVAGVLCILAALYLAIAFASYLYTWKYDQDKVLQFTWSSFFQKDLVVENWLGRLGAYLSNAFFYWGFGLPSIVFIILFFKLGTDLIRKTPLIYFLSFAVKSIAGMAFFSIVFEFLFRSSDFTWGGVFGDALCFWLTNFVGSIGLILLILSSVIAFIIVRFNPSFDTLVLPGGMQLPSFAQYPVLEKASSIISAMFSVGEDLEVPSKKRRRSGKKAESVGATSTSEVHKEETLRPSGLSDQEEKPEAVEGVMNFELPEIKKEKKKKYDPSALEMEVANPPEATPQSEEPQMELEVLADNDLNLQQAPGLNDVIREKTLNDVNQSEPYDPRLDLSNYVHPTLDLLNAYEEGNVQIDKAELEANKDQIIKTLLDYKIEITKIRATIGPTVTLYEIVPAAGVKISKIKNLEDDIALSLAALGIRIIAPIPGKGTIGIEVPNKKPQTVSLLEVLKSDKFQDSKMALPIALGKTISNEVFVADLAKMPHLLIAGATGQGKSVGINTILMSLLYKKHPSQVKLVLIDPKKVELFPYSSLEKHFLSFLPNEEEPILTETKKVIYTLNSLCIEMDARYDLLKAARARNIVEYNEKFVSRRLNPNKGHKFMPYIVLVIDEFADLIMTAGKEIELPIARLAQLARAIGIHLIIATQRPSVNIITGMIKANFPARLAFKVTSKIDSRTILDGGGAEQLIGRGDMLLNIGSSVVRLQCAFVDTPEVEDVIDHIGNQQGFPEPFYLPEYTGDEESGGDNNISLSDLDPMFTEAAKLVISNQHGSTSMLQRKLQLGYNRAGRIMDQLEKMGIVGPAQGSKPRDVTMISMDEFENNMSQRFG